MTLFFASCCGQRELTVRREWVTHGRLASVFARTPDPLKAEPYFGQRLLIHWRLPPDLFVPEESQLRLQLLFGNWERETLFFPLTSAKGWQIYSLMDHDFDVKEGILSYKVALFSQGKEIATWAHPTWANWIDAK